MHTEAHLKKATNKIGAFWEYQECKGLANLDWEKNSGLYFIWSWLDYLESIDTVDSVSLPSNIEGQKQKRC